MQIEQITLSNGEVILILPPSLYDLPVFEKSFHIICFYIQEWVEGHKDLSVNIELGGAVKKQFDSFVAIAFKKVPLVLDPIVSLNDLVLIKNGFEKVMVLEELPPFKLDKSKKTNEFQPKINETSDSYNNYIGDIVAGLEATGLELCKNYDLNSIRQILYRVDQHKYWSDPQNLEKAQQQKDIEDYGDMLYELSEEW